MGPSATAAAPLLTTAAMANGEFDAYLPQGSGYAIIIGGGSGFALFMLILSWLQNKFTEMSPFESKSSSAFLLL